MGSITETRRKAFSLIDKRHFSQARTLLFKVQTVLPDDSEIMLAIGVTYSQEGDFVNAENWLRKANKIDASSAIVHFHLANALRQQQKLNDAISHYQIALDTQPNVFEVHMMLASTLLEKKQLEDAEYHFQCAIKLRPDSADCYVNLGQTYEMMHKLEDACSACEKALQLQPKHIGGLMLSGRLNSRKKCYIKAKQDFRQVLANVKDNSLIAKVNFELGHVLDKLGQYDKAYKEFAAGNSKMAQLVANIDFDKNEHQKHIENNTSWFTQASFKKLASATTDAKMRSDPIFLVGFPRSGTTLTEQILNQHPDVVTSNESIILQSAIEAYFGTTKKQDITPYKKLLSANSEELNSIRSNYWQLAKEDVPCLQRNNLFVDKQPLNLVHLGVISRIFPGARIIVAIRDPRDVCLSCFMQDFTPNPATANYFTLSSTVNFYTQVMTMWLHYKQVLPARWHQYRYEDLVDDFESTSRGLFDFLNLEYPGDTANFHITAKNRMIGTPSYQDVTTPIYKRSKERWQNYRKQFSPHVEKLAPFIDEFGYSRK